MHELPANPSAPTGTHGPPFDHGLRVAAACDGVLLVWLYGIMAPERDIRARIPFLLGVFSLSTWLELLAIASLAGLVGLVITGGWSWRALAGLIVGAAFSLLILASGIFDQLIPATYESPPKYGWLAAALIAAGFTLWHARRRLRRGGRAA